MPVHAHAEELRHPGSGDNASTGVLLSHGFTGSPFSMRPFGEHLAELGYGVAVPRLPGHGTSWQELNTTCWQDWHGTVDAEFLRLRKEHDRVFVVGLSMGGCLMLRLAEEHGEDVSGVVLVNPSVSSDDKRLLALPVMHRVVPSLAAIGNDIKKTGVDVHHVAADRGLHVRRDARLRQRRQYDVGEVRVDLTRWRVRRRGQPVVTHLFRPPGPPSGSLSR